MLEFIIINTPSDVKNEVLQERLKRAQGGRSQDFVAVLKGSELAVLSYEDWTESSFGFVYEIFVLPNHRRQGIGSALLSYAEKYAVKLGCTSVQLKVNAFDRTVNKEWLVSWYKEKGYAPKADDSEILEKVFEPLHWFESNILMSGN